MAGETQPAGCVHARVALSALWSQLADYATAHVSAANDGDALPGEHVRSARRARVLTGELFHLAIVLERLEGASWEDLAGVSGLEPGALAERYEEAVAQFRCTGAPAWQPPEALFMPVLPARHELRTEAIRLDEWLRGRGDLTARPVSRLLDNIARIGPPAESSDR